MPGFTTHYIFGIKAYHELNDNHIKKMISSNLFAYQLGLQGPDIFFYHLPTIYKNPSHGLASMMHESKTGLFFENFMKEIRDYKDKAKDIAYAYLSGFLCHYCLDTICHPYIYAKTNYVLNETGTLQNFSIPIYYADHRSFETLIDSLILERYKHKKPSSFKKDKTVFLDQFSTKIISSLLSTCINKTYYKRSPLTQETLCKAPLLKVESNMVVTPNYIRKVIHSVRIESKVLSNLMGYKKRIVEQVENRFVKYKLLSSLIPIDNFVDDKDALNLAKSSWCSPWDPHVIRYDSFIKLFQLATKKCTSILDLIDSLIHKTLRVTFCEYSQGLAIASPTIVDENYLDIKVKSNKSCKKYTDMLQIMKAIGNLSYHSGLTI